MRSRYRSSSRLVRVASRASDVPRRLSALPCRAKLGLARDFSPILVDSGPISTRNRAHFPSFHGFRGPFRSTLSRQVVVGRVGSGRADEIVCSKASRPGECKGKGTSANAGSRDGGNRCPRRGLVGRCSGCWLRLLRGSSAGVGFVRMSSIGTRAVVLSGRVGFEFSRAARDLGFEFSLSRDGRGVGFVLARSWAAARPSDSAGCMLGPDSPARRPAT